jgi:hypothetical protein
MGIEDLLGSCVVLQAKVLDHVTEVTVMYVRGGVDQRNVLLGVCQHLKYAL